MNISNLFNEKKVVFSFEIFPPKKTSPIKTVYETLNELAPLNPDFISVTYGAGGTLTENRTTEITSLIKNVYGIEALAHLTCISSTREEIDLILDGLKREGIENVLALRGDIPLNQEIKGDFKYASDLISHINNRNDFNIVAACYPEGHQDCRNLSDDILSLKLKQDAGANHFVSQLFFDNNYFYEFMDKASKEGITVPVQAGIMPVINKAQIERITALCGAKLPTKFIKIMEKYEYDKEALRDAGIAYATEQIIDLISSGTRGIHLYTMNNPIVAKQITNSIGTILKSLNKEVVK